MNILDHAPSSVVEQSTPTSARSSAWRGSFFLLFVALFAFLLGSFPARNNDLWLHLSLGREAIQDGNLSNTIPGLEIPSQGNNSWLFDGTIYTLFRRVGAEGLIVIKSLVVAFIGILLLQVCRKKSDWWLASLTCCLALLTMSTRFLLQPSLLGCLFLIILLLSLYNQKDPLGSQTLFPTPSLIALFFIWANVDMSFVIGLGTVLMIGIGRLLDSNESQSIQEKRNLLFRWLVLVAICFINPTPLRTVDKVLAGEWFSSSTRSIVSPFEDLYFNTLGASAAGLAYYPLMGMTLLSFVLNWGKGHWQRFLPWVGISCISLFQVRAIPFFAIISAPVLAWNLQDFFARRSDRETSQFSQQPSLLLRFVTVILGMIFVLSAWPGWLQSPPYEPRNWKVEINPSLEHMALTVRDWQAKDQWKENNRFLLLAPDSGFVLSWYCPNVKGVVDESLANSIFTSNSNTEWQAELRRRAISHLLVHDTDRSRLFERLNRLFVDPNQWALVYLEGDVAIFGWLDPTQPASGNSLPRIDFDQLAYRPLVEKRAPGELSEVIIEPRNWYDDFLKKSLPRPTDREEANIYLSLSESFSQSTVFRNLFDWEKVQFTGLVGSAPIWNSPIHGVFDAVCRTTLIQPQPSKGQSLGVFHRLGLALQRQFAFIRDDTPPALLYLAIRSARRAIANNPDDAQAYLALGEGYLQLLHKTRERYWGTKFKEVLHLRRAQASFALNQAITLKPDLAAAHLNLGWLYRELGYLDLSLKYRKMYLQLTQQAGPPPGVSTTEFREHVATQLKELNDEANSIQTLLNLHATESEGKRVLDRAMMATDKGLAGKALEILIDSDIAAFGEQGMALELELLLRTGRANDVLDWTISSEHKLILGDGSYYWLRAQAQAAIGQYLNALDTCELLATYDQQGGQLTHKQKLAGYVGQMLLQGQATQNSIPEALFRELILQRTFSIRVFDIANSIRREADALVLRALLAIELGDMDAARKSLGDALKYWSDEATAASGAGIDFNGRAMAQNWLEILNTYEKPQ